MAGPPTSPTSILLVANASEQADLRRHFAEPLSTGPVDVLAGDGGDDTFGLFGRIAPEIVVVCATLESGDARALLEAMRSANPGGFRSVLIGDERGPVRNALDASDFGVDRFVARPIAAKALRFAVASLIDAQRAPRRTAESPAATPNAVTMISGAGTPAPMSSSPDAATMIMPGSATLPGTGPKIEPAKPRGTPSAGIEIPPGRASSSPDIRPTPPPIPNRSTSSPDLRTDGTPPSASASAPAPAPASVSAPVPVSTPGAVSAPVSISASMSGSVTVSAVPVAAPASPSGPHPAVEPPPESVRTELRARWTALADAISDHDVDVGADDDIDDIDDDPPPDAEPSVIRPPPGPVVIRPRRSDPAMKIATPEPDVPAAAAAPAPAPAPDVADAVPAPVSAGNGSGSISFLEHSAVTPLHAAAAVAEGARLATAALAANVRPARAAPTDADLDDAEILADAVADDLADADDLDVRDEFREPNEDPAEPDPEPAIPLREPTLILPEHGPRSSAASAPIPTAFSDEVVVTERRVSERWSSATPVHALSDDGAARREPGTDARIRPPGAAPTPPPPPASASTPAPVAVAEPLRADLGDEPPDIPTRPPLTGTGTIDVGLDDVDDENLPEPPADEPPLRPSDPALPSGTDFARELRRKMSAMAQRLFKSTDSGAPPSDLAPRHDHKTEIDLAALVDGPAAGAGVTEIEARDERPARDDTPGTTDTQVRMGAESGDIIRGVSDAAAILSRAFARAFTGRAVMRQGEVEKAIFFDRGRPVFASSNQTHDRMGQLLVREGKITPDQFGRCQTIVAASGRRIGEILIDLGYLKRRELLPAVRRHVEDIIYGLFGWNAGSFQMHAGDGAAGERIRLSRHPAGMILEGVRRKLGTTELERLVGPPTTIVDISDKDKLATLIGTADLSAEERAAVAALDGTNDLAAVARVSGIELANVLQLAWGLIVLGVAHARRRDHDLDDEGAVLVGETDLAIDRDRVRARWQLVSDADYFALLGVRRDASGFEIKRAYEAARRDFAPDGFPAELRRELARELDDIAQVLDEAFHVLRDDGLRGAYLRHLRD